MRILVLLAGALLAYGQSLPLEPPHESGSNVTGAFEGWFKNPDGSFNLLLGYFNRNTRQELDIPIGPNNRIEPGGPDRGQPAHFLAGRQWGLFVVKVPGDFGGNKLTWTLTVNGKSSTIPASLLPDYEISPLKEEAVGNTPPILRFDPQGPSVQGPQGLTVERTATLANPLTLTAWVADDGKFTNSSGARPRNMGDPIRLRWTKYRGPGTVTFAKSRPAVENGSGTTTARFSEAGEYVLHLLVNDYSGDGGGGFQCCWTNGEIKVSVKP
jgi:hypothetical protein